MVLSYTGIGTLCGFMFILVGCEPSVEPSVQLGVEAVEGVTDQTELADIAMNTKEWKVSRVPLYKRTDEDLLTKLPHEAPVYVLTDQDLLAKLAHEAPEAPVRRVAVRRLTDQSALQTVAMHDKVVDIRLAAWDKLTDPALRAQVDMAKLTGLDMEYEMTKKRTPSTTAAWNGFQDMSSLAMLWTLDTISTLSPDQRVKYAELK